MNADETPASILQLLASDETLLWSGRPAIRIKFLEILLIFLALAAFVKFIYLDGHVLLYGEFPSPSANRDVNSVLGLVLVFVLVPSALKRSRRLRRLRHNAYALTDRRLIIVGGGKIQSFDRIFFQSVHGIKIVFDKDLVFELCRGMGDTAASKIALYGVRDPHRVACFIRCTLASHTLTHNLAGAVV